MTKENTSCTRHGARRILIIDDNPDDRIAIKRCLEGSKEPYDILEAETGEEALQLLGKGTVDGVILDHLLPDISGKSLFTHIKRLFPKLPILMITGVLALDIIRDLKRLGAGYFLQKNEVQEKLLRTLKKILQAEPKKTAEPAQPRILVVDDEEIVHLTLSRILSKEGYQLERAMNADDALARIAEGFQLVMTDIRMPGIDGIEFLNRIKKMDPNLAVIVMTGYASIESANKATHLGAVTFLTKPFENHQELRECVRRALAKHENVKKNEEIYNSIVSGEVDTINVKGKLHLIPYFRENAVVVTKELMGRIHDGLVFVNAKGIITFSNTQFSELVEIPYLDLIGLPLESLVLEQAVPLYKKFFQNLQKIKNLNEFNLHLKSSSGYHIPILICGVSLGVEKKAGESFMLVVSDLSEIRRVQKKISALARLVDQAHFETILMYNAAGVITECNLAAERLFGQKKGSLLGISVTKLFQNLPKEILFDRSELSNTNRMIREAQAFGSYNKLIPVEISISQTIENELENELIGMLFVRDITEKEKLQKLKDEFLSVVSHELRTPLTTIIAVIDNLADGIAGELSAKQMKMVTTGKQNANRLKWLITNLLDLSRLESGKARIIKKALDLSAVLQNTSDSLRPLANEKNLTLNLKIPEKLPAVFADVDMVIQVLTNLINNAIHFARAHITIWAGVDSSDSVRITIIDDGVGLSKKDCEQLFNKFVQINRPQGGGGYKGTGLGLSICKQIVDQHGGKIWVESEEGNGSQFHFTLPCYEEKKHFLALLKESIVRAEKEASPLLLMTLHAENAAPSDLVRTLKFFQKLEPHLQEKVLRKSDQIFLLKEPPTLCFILQTDYLTAHKILHRAEKQILTFQKQEGNGLAPMQLGMAIYPDEESDPQRLFEFALTHHPHEIKKKVLVIDDEEDITDILTGLLKAKEYIVEAAVDGESGLEQALLFHPDVILLDLILPGIDGYEFCKRLRQNAATKQIPVIVVSAKEIFDQKKLESLGVETTLRKPFKNEDILACVQKAVL